MCPFTFGRFYEGEQHSCNMGALAMSKHASGMKLKEQGRQRPHLLVGGHSILIWDDMLFLYGLR